MENLTGIINLLGEENEKRLKDAITDLLILQVEKDIEDRYEYNFILNFDDIYEEVKEEVKDIVKERILSEYMNLINTKLP